ncbi:MAG: hypothetical protein OIF35_04895 [Cellvibrionaceae bacterium]|nr:hypothetical protein [Cellvibrionaceae bacterium]MCV6625221.1 hypothetical protein [Cellvibrionaceae bacterium]
MTLSRIYLSLVLALGLAAPSWADSLGHSYSDTWEEDSLKSMSNSELLAAAKAKRNKQMSHTQQALNYQWLAQHANGAKAKRSNKALRNMLKKTFKNYWYESSAKTKHKMVGGKDTVATNYGLKVSGNQVKLALERKFF